MREIALISWDTDDTEAMERFPLRMNLEYALGLSVFRRGWGSIGSRIRRT